MHFDRTLLSFGLFYCWPLFCDVNNNQSLKKNPSIQNINQILVFYCQKKTVLVNRILEKKGLHKIRILVIICHFAILYQKYFVLKIVLTYWEINVYDQECSEFFINITRQSIFGNRIHTLFTRLLKYLLEHLFRMQKPAGTRKKSMYEQPGKKIENQSSFNAVYFCTYISKHGLWTPNEAFFH